MPHLTLGAVTVKVTDFTRDPDESNGVWTKRAYTAQLIATSEAEATSIWNLASPAAGLLRSVNGQLRGKGSNVTVSGDLLPSMTARVVIGGGSAYLRYSSGWDRAIPVQLREV
jgi:hypothetical protein